MPQQIRYRLYEPWRDDMPRMGDHLMSQRGRGGYLIVGVVDKGMRGGLGEPVFRQLLLSVERVSRAECKEHDRLWSIKWDKRKRRASRRLN